MGHVEVDGDDECADEDGRARECCCNIEFQDEEEWEVSKALI
jgi:hypothetical protein